MAPIHASTLEKPSVPVLSWLLVACGLALADQAVALQAMYEEMSGLGRLLKWYSSVGTLGRP